MVTYPGKKKLKKFNHMINQTVGITHHNSHGHSSHGYGNNRPSYGRPSYPAAAHHASASSGQIMASSSSSSPPLTNLSQWFDYHDRDRSGALNKEEVVAALAQTYGNYGKLVDISSIRESVYSMWSMFDKDFSGKIEKHEFLSPGGLGESLQAMMGVMSSSTAPSYSGGGGGGYPGAQSYSGMPSGVHTSNTYQGRPQQHPHPPSQQQQYKMMRVNVPAGMTPGQLIKIPLPSGALETITIPPYTSWKTNASGQQTFDLKVADDSIPQATAIPASSAPPYNSTYSSSSAPPYNSTYSSSSAPPYNSNYSSSSSMPEPAPQSFQSWHTFRGDSQYHGNNAHSIQNIPINPSQFIQPSGRRRALLIGINYYGTQAALCGCINDAKNMQQLLLQQGYPNDSEHMLLLTDDRSNPSNHQPTGQNISKAFRWLLQGVAKGDMLFFHYSGHGSQVPDKTGFEKDGLNETILPVDYKKGQLKDDQLWEQLVFPLPNGARLAALMDCCHSGTGLDLPYEYQLPNRRTYNSYSLDSTAFSNGRWIEDVNSAHSQGDVVLFSGCQDDQTSADVGGGALSQYQAGGAMTQSFIQAFQSNPYATYPQFLSSIHNSLKQRGFKQRPQLTSSQQFDVNSRIFSFTDGIESNTNPQIGRIQRKKFKPAKKYGGAMDSLLGINASTAVGILLGAMVLDSIF